MKHWGFKKDLFLRGENVFYHRLAQLVPELTKMERVLDEPVEKLLGKRKRIDSARPDYFHVNRDTMIALHGEYDEQ
ncbi:unnamed protein product, partial [Chrysoparadoxa australica]